MTTGWIIIELLLPPQIDIQNFLIDQPNDPYCLLGRIFLEELKKELFFTTDYNENVFCLVVNNSNSSSKIRDRSTQLDLVSLGPTPYERTEYRAFVNTNDNCYESLFYIVVTNSN